MSIDRRALFKSSIAASAMATLPGAAASPAKPLAGKSILITGCSSGFGYLSALHLARHGAKMIASMRNMPRAEARELADTARKEKLDFHIVEIDVLSDESVASGVAAAERIAGGALDIVINNAGIVISGPVEVQDMLATQLIFDTNVFGVQRMMRAALPAMRARKSGLIFNISSQLGRVIFPGLGHYSASKFALEAMSEQIAYELVPHNIDVTIIQPGGYPTEVGDNRNIYTAALKARSEEGRLAAYPALTANMGNNSSSGSADPMDIPRAIADIAMMPPGKRPLRRAVHPGNKPQIPVNDASAKAQLEWLGATGFAAWVKAALD